MPQINVRCTPSERLALEERAQGQISKYVRSILFEGGAQPYVQELAERMSELIESNNVVGEGMRVLTEAVAALEAREPAAAPPRKPGSAVRGARLEGMLLELLLLQRATASVTLARGAQAEVERVGLPVVESAKPDSKPKLGGLFGKKAS